MHRIRRALFIPLLLATASCGGGSTGPSSSGLVAGTYQASFTVPFSQYTPGGLIGDHQFTFRVTNPDDPSSFSLVSSRHRSRTANGDPTSWESDYLSPSTSQIIASAGFQWRVRWSYKNQPSLSVNVTMVQRDGGGYDVQYCMGVNGTSDNYPGTNCAVDRVN